MLGTYPFGGGENRKNYQIQEMMSMGGSIDELNVIQLLSNSFIAQ